MVPYWFLHWSLSHTYNHNMNDNDVADQYCLVYRMMRFQRQTKWWWALFMFFWENSMANAYHLMRSYYKHMGYKMTIDHWTFQENCAWALLDPDKYWPTRKRRNGASVEKVSSSAPRTPAAGKRRPKLSKNAMAADGALKKRLDASLRHWPAPLAPGQKRSTCCQLCRFAKNWVNKDAGKPTETSKPPGSRSDVLECGDCGVALCVRCWAVYHTKKSFGSEDYADVLAS